MTHSLDDLLRCPICKEHFRNPVLISGCSHNFCSECIRRTTLVDSKCPQCRANFIRENLLPNKILNNILTVHRNNNTTKQCVSKSSSVTQPACKQKAKTESFSGKKRKQSSTGVRSGENCTAPKTKRRKTNGTTVTCPICKKQTTKAFINKHIDKCIGPSTPSSSSTNGAEKHTESKKLDDIGVDEKKSPERTRAKCPIKRIPFLIYSDLKEKELQKILQKLHLNIKGKKSKLVKRHKEFVLMHNSQIDAYLNGNDIVPDRDIARQINHREIQQIHSQFFAKSNNRNVESDKVKQQRKQLSGRLIRELKQRMGKKWCRKRRKFRAEQRHKRLQACAS